MENGHNNQTLDNNFEILRKYLRTSILFRNLIPEGISSKEKIYEIIKLFKQIKSNGIKIRQKDKTETKEASEELFPNLTLEKFKEIFILANSDAQEQRQALLFIEQNKLKLMAKLNRIKKENNTFFKNKSKSI